jgi:hypothetical protein
MGSYGFNIIGGNYHVFSVDPAFLQKSAEVSGSGKGKNRPAFAV